MTDTLAPENAGTTAQAARRQGLLAALIIALVVIADQILKIWVKTHFYLGEDYPITSWFHLKFIENNGIAFGLELTGKLFLTLARLLAVAFIIYFIIKVRNKPGVKTGLLACVALIAAGAFGNIVDCVFYGVIFNNPPAPWVATLFPPDGGYSGWLEGRVVDMLYFPMFTLHIGNFTWEFFQYIFNIADAAISVGVIAILLFYRNNFGYTWELFFKSFKKK